MIKKLYLLFSLFISFSSALHAQSINKHKLDSLLNNLAANNKSMGSLVISQKGKVIYQKAVGFAATDSNNSIPATIKTKYRIGSITKMFTGVITFQLIEEGKLTLNTMLDKFYPQVPNAGKITIGMLLSHRSGLFNITNTPAFASYMLQPQSHEQLLAKIAALTAQFEPGEKYEYSNTNFILLGYIVEKIAHKPYPQLVKQRIIDKIGLKDTYYGAKINTANNEALPYNLGRDWKEAAQTDMSIPGGAGAMVSTPADLVKFEEALFAGKLISKASVLQMQPSKDNYGMAMAKVQLADKVGYGHNGAIDAFRSVLAYYPDEQLAIAYTSNGGTWAPERVAAGALSIYLNEHYTVPLFKKLALKTEDLDKYLGIYASPDFPLKITVSKNNTTLIGTAAGQGSIYLEATGKDIFSFEPNDILMEFKPAEHQFILKQNGKVKVFTRE